MKKKGIGKLYQEQFENFEAPVGPQEWAALQSGIVKAQFYTFHAAQFNVYYLAAAGLVATTGAGVGIYKYVRTEKPEQPVKKEILQPVPVPEIKQDTVLFEDFVQKEQLTTDKKVFPEERKAAPMLIDTSSVLTNTESGSKEEVRTEMKKDTTAIPKKVVYINKRDTIIVNDTLDSPPPKRKRKNAQN